MVKKNIKCLDCIHCKTIKITKMKTLGEWCCRKAINPSKIWPSYIKDYGYIRLIWCDLQSGAITPRNAQPKNVTNSETAAELEKTSAVVTDRNKKFFIKGCPVVVS